MPMITLINYVDIDVSYSYEISTGCDFKKLHFFVKFEYEQTK